MSVQLNYEGGSLPVQVPDATTTCQYLYDFAQNQFQCLVEILFMVDQNQGKVDPSWTIYELASANAQFFVQPIQDGNQNNPMQTGSGEIQINIYVNDQPTQQIKANAQQTLKEILDYMNQGLQSQFQQLELWDSQGQGLTNNPQDYVGSYAQAAQPLLLFIPGCISGIQSFLNVNQAPIGQPQVQIPAQLPPQINNPPSTGSVSPAKQQSDSSEARIKESIQSLKVQKNFSLFIDSQGQFVIYKFHFPILFSGTLRISNSKPKKSFNESIYEFVPVNTTKFAEIDDYGFAIKWSNGNVSTVKIGQQ